MKVSIVTAILNSPEIVRRQMLYWKQMNLPADVEVIYIDDGSKPPLQNYPWFFWPDNFNFTLLETHDYRKWTQPAARNRGVNEAVGDWVMCTDIDHIFTWETIDFVRQNTEYDVIRFKRYAAILTEDGLFSQDVNELLKWGLKEKYVGRNLRLSPHGNSYAIKRSLYLSLGGVSERHVGTGKYPNREEAPLKRKLKQLENAGKIKILREEGRPAIHMMPNGHFCGGKDYNPFGLFHKLSRYSNKELRKMRRDNKK